MYFKNEDNIILFHLYIHLIKVNMKFSLKSLFKPKPLILLTIVIILLWKVYLSLYVNNDHSRNISQGISINHISSKSNISRIVEDVHITSNELSNLMSQESNNMTESNVYEVIISDSEAIATEDSVNWCKETQQNYHVKPGTSWGNLIDNQLRDKWKDLECNSLVNLANTGVVSCSDIIGEKFIQSWKKSKISICGNDSNIISTDSDYCLVSIHDNFLCHFHQLVFDFNKMSNELGSNKRKFGNDFALIYNCDFQESKFNSISSMIKKYIPSINFQSRSLNIASSCDVVINDPVVLISHDSVQNFGHMFEDILNVFLTLEVNSLNSKEVVLLNIDGLRQGNVLLGAGHFILDSKYPDDLMQSPFRLIYQILFKDIIKPIVNTKFCFNSSIYFFPIPIKAFLWEKFEIFDKCSSQLQPSYIYRKFIVDYHTKMLSYKSKNTNFLIENNNNIFTHPKIRYIKSSGSKSETLRLLIVTRKLVTSSKTREIAARAFANIDDIIDSIKKTFQDIELFIVDFSDISFELQVTLAYNIDIMIGFHGAGINHFFHMNYLRSHCCGVIELFPQKKGKLCVKEVCRYYLRQAHGNHARYLGYKYIPLISDDDSFTESGTIVNIQNLEQTISTMMKMLAPNS